MESDMMEDKIFTEEMAAKITAKLNADLVEVSPFTIKTEFFINATPRRRNEFWGDMMTLCVVKNFNGMEYAHIIMMTNPEIDYAPAFRGWWAEITEKLEKADNRSAA